MIRILWRNGMIEYEFSFYDLCKNCNAYGFFYKADYSTVPCEKCNGHGKVFLPELELEDEN